MQIKKDDVREKILSTAIKLFCAQGVANTSLSHIAAEAHISVGNIYRYFANKEDLLQVAVPVEVGRSLQKQLQTLMKSTGQGPRKEAVLVRDHLTSLLQFTVSHREVLLILFSEEVGTSFSGFRAEVTEVLYKYAAQYFRKKYPEKFLDKHRKDMLKIIYQSYVESLIKILRQSSSSEELINQTKTLRKYHLHGLSAVFEEKQI